MQMADGEGITSDKEVDQLKKPYEDSKAGDLFRKKGLAIPPNGAPFANR